MTKERLLDNIGYREIATELKLRCHRANKEARSEKKIMNLKMGFVCFREEYVISSMNKGTQRVPRFCTMEDPMVIWSLEQWANHFYLT